MVVSGKHESRWREGGSSKRHFGFDAYEERINVSGVVERFYGFEEAKLQKGGIMSREIDHSTK